jgi:hypothetical protein
MAFRGGFGHNTSSVVVETEETVVSVEAPGAVLRRLARAFQVLEGDEP